MPEFVNDIHGSPEKNKKDSEPSKRANSQPQDKSLPEPPGPDSPGAIAQESQENNSIPAVDNSSFEQLFENKFFGENYDLPSDVKNDDLSPRSILDDEPEGILPRIDPTYFDLIKEGKRDQVTLGQEDVDPNLVGVLAKNLNSRDQFSTPEDEEIPQASLTQDQFVHLYHSQNTQKSGFWTRAAMPGSVMVLAVVVVSGVFMKSPGISGSLEENLPVAQAASLFGLKSTPSVDEKKIAEVLLADSQKSSEAANMTEFVPPPAFPGVTEAAKPQENVLNQTEKQAQDKQLDVERAIKLDSLNAKLKIVRAYKSSRQRAYNVAAYEKKPVLLEEVTKIQAETSSLEEKIAALQPSQSVAQTTGADKTVAADRAPSKVPAGAGSGESEDIKSTAATAAAPSANPKSRSPERVELAMASAPGLYLLEPFKRSRLKAKLVDGECLVPALSSVYPQVPALVMRDMVRQFEGQC